jgi:hypothetical protein
MGIGGGNVIIIYKHTISILDQIQNNLIITYVLNKYSRVLFYNTKNTHEVIQLSFISIYLFRRVHIPLVHISFRYLSLDETLLCTSFYSTYFTTFHLKQYSRSGKQPWKHSISISQLKNHFKKYPESGSGTRAREQLLESVRANIQWRAKYEKPIDEWLDTTVRRNLWSDAASFNFF